MSPRHVCPPSVFVLHTGGQKRDEVEAARANNTPLTAYCGFERVPTTDYPADVALCIDCLNSRPAAVRVRTTAEVTE